MGFDISSDIYFVYPKRCVHQSLKPTVVHVRSASTNRSIEMKSVAKFHEHWSQVNTSRNVKRLVAATLYGTQISPRLVWSALRGKAIVFMFHRVLPPLECAEYYDRERVISTSAFDPLLKFLKKNFLMLSFADLLNGLQGSPPDRPVCCLTFDDGWQDNYRCAWPALLRHRLSATVFLTLDYIGRKHLLWPDELYRLWSGLGLTEKEQLWQLVGARFCSFSAHQGPPEFGSLRRMVHRLAPEEREDLLEYLRQEVPSKAATLPDRAFLNWDEIRLMMNDGVSYGSHTLTHPALTNLSYHQVKKELHESKRALEENLRQPVEWFAYPFGNFDAHIVAETRRAGYRAAATSVPATARFQQPGSFLLPRVGLCETMVTDRPAHFSEDILLLHLAKMLVWAEKARFGVGLYSKKLDFSGQIVP